jgi:hypothetical protein
MVMLRFLSCAPESLVFPHPPPLLLFALNLSRRLAAVALSGMVNTDLVLRKMKIVGLFGIWTCFPVPKDTLY